MDGVGRYLLSNHIAQTLVSLAHNSPEGSTRVLWFNSYCSLLPKRQSAGGLWGDQLARRSLFAITPVHHLPPDRIRAHALICFLALVLYRVMRMRLKARGLTASPRTALDLLARIHPHQARITDRKFEGTTTLTPEQLDLFEGGLLNLRTYIEQNRGSLTNYGARYREGKRIASTSAEASGNNLVTRRMVKKRRMRWSKRGANLLLQVRVALANGDLAERLAYQPPIQPRQTIISPFVPLPLFQRAA
jgi:hypothetical protein